MAEDKKKINIKNVLIEYNTYFIFLLLILVSSIMSEYFFTSGNLINILLQQAGPILVAIGMLFVILTGGIDLSVGSVMAVGASVSAILITDLQMNFILAIIIAVLV